MIFCRVLINTTESVLHYYPDT